MWNFDIAHKPQYYPKVIIDTLKQSKQKDDTITREDMLMGIKRFDHKTKVKVRSERQNL